MKIAIKLLAVRETAQDSGRFVYRFFVRGKIYRAEAEWGDVSIPKRADKAVLFEQEERKVTVGDVIALAIHGIGPTDEGARHVWTDSELVKALKAEVFW